uniref:chaperone protein dnaJ 11, chloroplastic-like n=1 Tax=Erigeron canadensis TaxID=72917 RepID=UPI001CB9579B|nr:chaperone protein dnaJ 11, chloroplastic-like [Erigeron canadensis]
MAITSTSFSMLTPSSNFTFKSNSPQLYTNYVKCKGSRVSAAYATATAETETIRSFRNVSHSTTLYDVLGVRVGADIREVKSAYRKLARVLHPDVESSDSSADEFMKIHSAYTTLTDPEKRADYDRTLFVNQRRTGSSPVRTSASYKSRRWETDQCW